MADGYWTYSDDHFVRYINVESLCCTLETIVILYVNYTLKINGAVYKLNIPHEVIEYLSYRPKYRKPKLIKYYIICS